MAENTNMEKHYFSWIMENPEQISKVEPYFFRNGDIQFIYTVIREEYLRSETKLIPSHQQIYSMVKLSDPDNKISDKTIKILLEFDNSDISEEWLIPRFKAWKIRNQLKGDMLKGIDMIRGLEEEVDYDNVTEIAERLKTTFSNVMLVDDDDQDLGLDFDDPENHKQLISKNSIPTGWISIDSLLGGGWSKSTLNVLMGETNVGKSMWLNNIAVNAANAGSNVLFITLEMGWRKVMKRIGSMRLKINIDEYDEKSKDAIFMKNRLNNLKSQVVGGLFEASPGKIFVKKYNTSDCTVTDIDNYIKKFEETKRIKVNMVIVDYINIMSIEKGHDFVNMLYLKGKHLAEGLRRVADKYDCCVVTATQVDKAVWGASDIKLADIPESKAIADTADSVWGIIRNSEMKRNNIYRLKILKLRDGEHKEEQVRFDFNTKFLTIENDTLVGTK